MTIQDATGPLLRVYVRPPRAVDGGAWQAYGWHAEPDAATAAAEHDAFRSVLAAAGAEVVVGTEPVDGDPDAIYAYDPALMTDDGAILLRPGKPGRRSEPAAFGRELAAAGIPTLGVLEAPATAEGGDMFWLDRDTLLVGMGYRTNEAGIDALRRMLEPAGTELITFDLPHLHGPGECLHLMSFVSMLAPDLAVAYLPLMPVRLIQLLAARGVALVEVPEVEFPSMGSNVLALAPRVALALEGNPRTCANMEAAGVEVRTYRGEHISLLGDGGPTCLTKPLARG